MFETVWRSMLIILKTVGCTCIHATIANLCWHGAHSHFRRSPGIIWVSFFTDLYHLHVLTIFID